MASWRLPPAPHAFLCVTFLLHAVPPSVSHECALDGVDLRNIPPLTFTLPLEDTEEPFQWTVGFCRRSTDADGPSCSQPDSPGYLQQRQGDRCVADFTLLNGARLLPTGVQISLQEPPAIPGGHAKIARVKVVCRRKTTGPPRLAMEAVKVLEDLGVYLLTFQHACACKGACIYLEDRDANIDGFSTTPSPLPASISPDLVGTTPSPSPFISAVIDGVDDESSESTGTLPAAPIPPSYPAPASDATPPQPPDATPAGAGRSAPSPAAPPSASASPPPAPTPVPYPSPPPDLCSTVVCTPLDQCHDAGVCNPATGTCTDPLKPDGTSCTDHNAKTYLDQCLAGTCRGQSLFCFNQPCKNGGRCIDDQEACECFPPWGGPTCEDEWKDPCDPSPCHHGGVCSVVDAQPRCTCAAGFDGPRCEGVRAPAGPDVPPTAPAAHPLSPARDAEPHLSGPRDASLGFHGLAWSVVGIMVLVIVAAVASQVATAKGYCFEGAAYHPMPTDVEMEDIDVNPFAHPQ